MPDTALGPFIVTSAADDTQGLDIDITCGAGNQFYIDQLILQGQAGMQEILVNLTNNDASINVNIILGVGGVEATHEGRLKTTGTITGLTGLGTGTITTYAEAQSDHQIIPFFGFPWPGTELIISSPVTDGHAAFATLFGRNGPPPSSDAPSMFVTGVSGGQAIPVSAAAPIAVSGTVTADLGTLGTTPNPLVIKGAAGGTAVPISGTVTATATVTGDVSVIPKAGNPLNVHIGG